MTVVEERKQSSGGKQTRSLERLHVSLPAKLKDKLEELQDITYATSASDVIRDALIVYAALVEEHRNGKELCVRDPEGNEIPYRLFMLG